MGCPPQGVSLERSSQRDASAVASFLAMDPPRHDKMRALVSKGYGNWGRFAAEFEGRTAKQCRKRWLNHLDTSIRRDPWTEQEDEIIGSSHLTRQPAGQDIEHEAAREDGECHQVALEDSSAPGSEEQNCGGGLTTNKQTSGELSFLLDGQSPSVLKIRPGSRSA